MCPFFQGCASKDQPFYLPGAAPGLSGRRDGQFLAERQLLDVDALVPGQRGVPGARLQAQPALVLEADPFQILRSPKPNDGVSL